MVLCYICTILNIAISYNQIYFILLGIQMSQAIKLSDELYKDAAKYAKVESRSLPKQIEYWSKIGKIAEDNPELTYNMIKEILLSKQELLFNEVSDYEFDK